MKYEGNNKNFPLRRWAYLGICAVGLLFVGVIYAWSILKIPLGAEYGWTSSQLAFTYTLTMCCFCLGSLVAGWISKKTPPKIMLIAGGGSILAGYVLTAALPGSTIVSLYLTYGVLIGGGIGVAYNTLLATGNSWFPDKKGTSSGVLMMCFGLSTLVLGSAASSLFSIPGFGWRKTFIGLGGAIFLVLLGCAMLLKTPEPEDRLPKALPKASRRQEFESRDYSAREMICRPAFWVYYVYGVLSAAIGSAVFSFARELVISFGAAETLATTVVGVLSVCNGLGRILCGLSFDGMGRRTTMFLSGGITLCAPVLMLIALSGANLWLAVAALCLAGISYGTNPTISSAFVSEFYGNRDFPLNYSISNTKLLFSSFTATAATALLGASGSYTVPFLLLTGMAALSFVLIFLFAGLKCIFDSHKSDPAGQRG